MTNTKTNTPYTERQMVTTDVIGFLSKVRGGKLSLPAILCLSIVNENFSAKYPMVYPGEVESVYRSIVAQKNSKVWNTVLSTYPEDKRPWSYSAVCRMLRVLTKRGYLNRQRDGRYVAYGMTKEGIELLVDMFGKSACKSPKLKSVK